MSAGSVLKDNLLGFGSIDIIIKNPVLHDILKRYKDQGVFTTDEDCNFENAIVPSSKRAFEYSANDDTVLKNAYPKKLSDIISCFMEILYDRNSNEFPWKRNSKAGTALLIELERRFWEINNSYVYVAWSSRNNDRKPAKVGEIIGCDFEYDKARKYTDSVIYIQKDRKENSNYRGENIKSRKQTFTHWDRKYNFNYTFEFINDADSIYRNYAKKGKYIRSKNFSSLGYETREEPFTSSFPHFLEIAIKVDNKNKNSIFSTEEDMSLTDFELIINQLRGKTNIITLSGSNKPSEHEDFHEFVLLCQEADIWIDYTNDVGVSPTVRWDYHPSTLEYIKELLRNKQELNIDFPLDNSSIDNAIMPLRDKTFPQGISSILFRFLGSADGIDEIEILKEDDTRVIQLAELIDQSEHNIKVDALAVPSIHRLYRKLVPQKIIPCEGGRFSCYISSDMKLYPCRNLQFNKFGISLRDHSIEEAWNSEVYKNIRAAIKDRYSDSDSVDNCADGCPLLDCYNKEKDKMEAVTPPAESKKQEVEDAVIYANIKGISLATSIADTETNVQNLRGESSGLSSNVPETINPKEYLITDTVLEKYHGRETQLSLPIGIRKIGDSAFSNNPWIKTVIISEGVEDIGELSFFDCQSLKAVTLPSTVKKIHEYAFAFCRSLESINFPTGVTYIAKNTFLGCDNLPSTSLPASIAKKEDRGAINSLVTTKENTSELHSVLEGECTPFRTSASVDSNPDVDKKVVLSEFEENNNLMEDKDKTIDLEQQDKSNAGIIEKVPDCQINRTPENNLGKFKYDLQVEALDEFLVINGVLNKYLGKTQIEVPAEISKIGASAFVGNPYMSNVIIPEGVVEIGESAFQDCIQLETVVLPSSIRIIENRAFENCRKLSDVQLPTSLLALGKAVFKNCLSLRKLEIPESVMYIPSNTFKGCTALSSVIIPESVEFISSDAFKNTSSCLTLHVVDSSRAMQYAIDNEILYSIVDK